MNQTPQIQSYPKSKPSLKSKVRELRRRVRLLEAEVEELREYMEHLEEELREKDVRIRGLEEENWRLKGKIEELVMKVEELKSRARWW